MKKRAIIIISVLAIILVVAISLYFFNRSQKLIGLDQEGLTIESLTNSLEFDTKAAKDGFVYDGLDKNKIASFVISYLTPYPGLKYKYIMISQLQPIGKPSYDQSTDSIKLYRAWFRFVNDLESTKYFSNSQWDDYVFDIAFDFSNEKYSIYENKMFVTREVLSDEIKQESLRIAETNNGVKAYRESNPKNYAQMSYRFTYSNQNTDGSIYINESLGDKIISITLGYPDGPNPCPQRAVVNMDRETAEFVPCSAV